MGLDINGTRFILYAKTLGVDYSQSAMIGRQGLYLKPSELKENLVEFRFSFNEAIIHSIFNKNDGYSEELFCYLGANGIESFDNSAYEGATHIHDMNQCIPDNFKEQYSMLLDGGSLEHVFNFPVAIKNCMEMVKIGGHYLGITPTNNFMGHGFYQFSPELYFSVFTKENGFEIIDVIAFEDKKKAWFSVKNPSLVKGRGTLVNDSPTLLLVLAKRVARRSIFASLPQQSDYVTMWNQAKSSIDEPIDDKRELTKSKQSIKHPNSSFNPVFFKLIAPAEGIRTPNKTLQEMNKTALRIFLSAMLEFSKTGILDHKQIDGAIALCSSEQKLKRMIKELTENSMYKEAIRATRKLIELNPNEVRYQRKLVGLETKEKKAAKNLIPMK